MKLIFPILLFFISLYFSNQVISPSIAIVEPLIVEENSFLSNINTKNKNLKIQEYWVTITGYSSSPDETDETPYITASGELVKEGTAASNFLPFGTKFIIPNIFGDKIFTITDRMNERYNDRIDIWFPTKWEAVNFGKKYEKIVIVNFP